MEIEIGLIGGSGLYDLPFAFQKEEKVRTPFTDVSLTVGELGDKRVGFIPRHGKFHKKPPSEIPYKAHIYSLFKLGAEEVIATAAVGSLHTDREVGAFMVLDQVVDFTKKRAYTFFDGEFQVTMSDERVKEGVVHTDMTNPYCERLRTKIINAAEKLNENVFYEGTYICTEGPRYETAGEVAFFSQLGDVIGMTQVPEVFLAKELEMCYAAIAIVTNYAAGISGSISHEEVIETMTKKKESLITLLTRTVKLI